MRVGIELTEAAITRPAKQPISAASTYCRTMIGREGMPVTRAAIGVVADRVDVGAPARLAQEERDHDAGDREHPRSTSECREWCLVRAARSRPCRGLHCTTSSWNSAACPSPARNRPDRQRRKQRRDFGIGDQPAIDEPKGNREQRRRSAARPAANGRSAPSAAPGPAAPQGLRSAKCRCRVRSRRSPWQGRGCRALPRSAAASAYCPASGSRAGRSKTQGTAARRLRRRSLAD